MPQITINAEAPDFTLQDIEGEPVTLSQFKGEQPVLLILNRGFTWPFCRAHLAQLRQDYELFREREVAVLVTGPEDAKRFKEYFEKHRLPFTGLPDPKHEVLKRYGQEIKIFKFGRMPAQVLIDRSGIARYVHYGNSMSDIPTNAQILALVDGFNQPEESNQVQ